MVISDKHKFVFIMTPKTASQSIRFWLNHHYGGDKRSGTSHLLTIPHKCKDWFKFCCVRNPYSRAISLWFSAVYEPKRDAYGFRRACGSKELMPFLRWLGKTNCKRHNRLCWPQSVFLHGIKFDQIVRFENVRDELVMLPFYAGDIDKLPQRNVRSHRRPHWTEYCKDQEVVDLIQRWASTDFDEYGYSREIK